MALRRRQGQGRSSTFIEEKHPSPPEDGEGGTPPPSLMTSTTHSNPAYKDHSAKGGHTCDHTPSPRESANEGSFWGVLARKAKAIIDDEHNVPYQSEYLTQTRPDQGNLTLRKGMDSPKKSVNQNLEEGRPTVEYKNADFMEETRKIQTRRKGNNEGSPSLSLQNTSQEDLIKASRDVAMATAAKAKLLLRELKTVKADLAFAKQRCSQLEEENKTLREGREKGVFPTDDHDDMIRLQLETLLAEKARLAHENTAYARENLFLKEIVEYHHLSMEDVVYLDDEGIEEVAEDYPRSLSRMCSVSPPSRLNSFSSSMSRSSSVAREMMMLSAPFPHDAPSA